MRGLSTLQSTRVGGPLAERRNFGARLVACGERSRAGTRYLFHIVRTDTTFST